MIIFHSKDGLVSILGIPDIYSKRPFIKEIANSNIFVAQQKFVNAIRK